MAGKGQSAIEYLTTYGWMLLVVAIVGGAIFSTVQNSAQVQSTSGFQNADVQVNDYGLNEDGLQLSLRSASRDQVNIKKVEITDPETGITAEINPSETVPVGDTTQLNLQNVQTTGTSDTYDMEVIYDSGGLENLNIEGSITGSFGVFNRVSLQNAEFNRSTNELQIDVKNTGDNTTDSISYTVEANNTDYTGNLPNLNAGEAAQINISTDETYPLQSINLDVEGTRFTDSSSGLKCTPTQGLVSYWTFNEEHSMDRRVEDISGNSNHGSSNGNLEYRKGISGQSLYGEGTIIRVNQSESLKSALSSNNFTLSLFWKQIENDRQWEDILQYETTAPDEKRLERGNADKFDGSDYWFNMGNGNGKFPRLSDSDIGILEGEWFFFTGRRKADEVSAWLNGEKYDNYTAENDSKEMTSKLRINPEYSGSKMDEVRIYNRSLSQSEIQRLYEVRSEGWAVSGCRLTG